MTDAGGGFDPIPAAGAGADRFDQPSLFYLTHQSTIDQWHALRSAVAASLNEWFATTLQDALVGVADEREWGLSTAVGPPGYAHLLVHPPETPVLNHKPLVGVGLGWSIKGVNPISNRPFTCVRCSRSDPGRRAAETLLDSGGRAFRSAHRLKGSDRDAWPIWWYIKAQDCWWTDLDAYRDTIVAEVRRGAEGLGDALSAAALVPLAGSTEEDAQPEAAGPSGETADDIFPSA